VDDSIRLGLRTRIPMMGQGLFLQNESNKRYRNVTPAIQYESLPELIQLRTFFIDDRCP